MVGSYDMMCLFHTGLHGSATIAHPTLGESPSEGSNELRRALILLSVLFLHNLNISKAYSVGHLIVFPREVENRGTENVRNF